MTDEIPKNPAARPPPPPAGHRPPGSGKDADAPTTPRAVPHFGVPGSPGDVYELASSAAVRPRRQVAILRAAGRAPIDASKVVFEVKGQNGTTEDPDAMLTSVGLTREAAFAHAVDAMAAATLGLQQSHSGKSIGATAVSTTGHNVSCCNIEWDRDCTLCAEQSAASMVLQHSHRDGSDDHPRIRFMLMTARDKSEGTRNLEEHPVSMCGSCLQSAVGDKYESDAVIATLFFHPDDGPKILLRRLSSILAHKNRGGLVRIPGKNLDVLRHADGTSALLKARGIETYLLRAALKRAKAEFELAAQAEPKTKYAVAVVYLDGQGFEQTVARAQHIFTGRFWTPAETLALAEGARQLRQIQADPTKAELVDFASVSPRAMICYGTQMPSPEGLGAALQGQQFPRDGLIVTIEGDTIRAVAASDMLDSYESR